MGHRFYPMFRLKCMTFFFKKDVLFSFQSSRYSVVIVMDY